MRVFEILRLKAQETFVCMFVTNFFLMVYNAVLSVSVPTHTDTQTAPFLKPRPLTRERKTEEVRQYSNNNIRNGRLMLLLFRSSVSKFAQRYEH